MLSEHSQDRKTLLHLIKDAFWKACDRRGMPRITIRYGIMKRSGSGLEFNPNVPELCLSEKLSLRLHKHPDRERVWYMLEAVGHEFRHYEQYIRAKRSGINRVTKDMLPEEEARLVGHQHADDNIGKYTKEEINPVKSNLYRSFHGAQPTHIRKVKYTPPPKRLIKIGRLVRVEYEPEFPSKKRKTRYYHEMGDTGSEVLKSNAILATDEKGKNLYILKDQSTSPYPKFSELGILG